MYSHYYSPIISGYSEKWCMAITGMLHDFTRYDISWSFGPLDANAFLVQARLETALYIVVLFREYITTFLQVCWKQFHRVMHNMPTKHQLSVSLYRDKRPQYNIQQIQSNVDAVQGIRHDIINFVKCRYRQRCLCLAMDVR